ncbi:diguanylate cyclase domain-containing protein [Rhizobium helianthi]|uniref:diguanylate cyclase n=1 Tax=Rhizobium helianthi TaxID=1132695 RepID=A0ABW4LYQ6_9HYPH
MFNGASVYLIGNFIIAIAFASVFFAVAPRSRSRDAARWIGFGFAVASLSAPAELWVAYGALVQLSAVLAFATALGGLLLISVGTAALYGARMPWVILGAFYMLSVLLNALFYDVPSNSPVHSVSYQFPFAIACFACMAAVARSMRRAPIDRMLLIVLLFTGAHFVLKAYLAVAVGAGQSATDYLGTSYAVISQSLTAVLVVMTGLTLLAVLVLQIMADERTNSEVDSLSSLLNRRGFENKVQDALRRSPIGPHSVILCDLDHFKRVNDTHGHYSGDSVIRTFGKLLKASAPAEAVTGRLGGEEFCILLPQTSLDAAMMLAQAIRGAMEVQTIPGLPTGFRATASFGVSVFDEPQQLVSATRMADAALYDAKAAGRNCVRYRSGPVFVPKIVG